MPANDLIFSTILNTPLVSEMHNHICKSLTVCPNVHFRCPCNKNGTGKNIQTELAMLKLDFCYRTHTAFTMLAIFQIQAENFTMNKKQLLLKNPI